MKALEKSDYADNTIVVFFSDHGFHLGEKERWAKQSLWERSTRVPLIISVPKGIQNARCDRPVELLSLFPTLVELCGVKQRPGLEGVSVVPLLNDPEAKWVRPAITTYGQNNHAVRSERWRYIRYNDGSEELYDHSKDPNEWKNLLHGKTGSSKELINVIAEHKRWLPKTNVPNARGPQRKKSKKNPSRKGDADK